MITGLFVVLWFLFLLRLQYLFCYHSQGHILDLNPISVFSKSYFGFQRQCLGMKCQDNLCKRVAFATVVERSSVNTLVRVKAKPYELFNRTTSRCFFWVYGFLKLVSQWFNDIHTLPPSPSNSKIFNIRCI